MRRLIAAAIFLLSVLLLFTRLGHYALWDDEAVTALAGRGVWRTGDTSVVMGQNIVAYRSGLLLKGTNERSTPPLGAYIAAPFVGLSDGQPWIARLPFALIGLGSVGLILWWLYSVDAEWLTWLLFGMAIVGNVSFWLYNRQCRYYSPAIFSSIAVAYLYLNWNGSRWQLVLLAAASVMLLAANYLNYFALQVCMLVDYLIIGRKRRLLGLKDWLIVLLPQLLIGGFIVLIWNTLGTGNKEYIQGNSFAQRLQLVWMNLRDINRAEYGVGLLLVLAPVLYFMTRRKMLLRATLVLVAYIVIVSFLSPQVLKPETRDADIRYLPPVIPLCMAIGVLVLLEITAISRGLAITLAAIAFGSNVLGAVLTRDVPYRSTIISFLGELYDPPTDPFRPTVAWINANVQDHQSIWVIPDFMTYPLMYHAPQPIYAWQLDPKNIPEALKDVLPIHVMGRGVPEYVIAFGLDGFRTSIQVNGLNYDLVETKEVFPQQTYRPELFWHSFKTIPADRSTGRAVFFFKLVPRI